MVNCTNQHLHHLPLQLSITHNDAKRADGIINIAITHDDLLIRSQRHRQARPLRTKLLRQPTVNDAPTADHNADGGLHVIELFAGLGGLRLSLPEWLPVRRFTACEINPHAIATYNYNFHTHGSTTTTKVESQLHCHLVEQLPLHALIGDVWCLSPPCQPYTCTTGSMQLDDEDTRSGPLKHLIDVLTNRLTASQRPRWILLENVRGFIASAMHKRWTSALAECGYTYTQYNISPTQLGIPNARSRYYCLAERTQRFADDSGGINLKPPKKVNSSRAASDENTGVTHPYLQSQSVSGTPLRPLSDYVGRDLSSSLRDTLLVPLSILQFAWATDLSIVSEHDSISHCVTGGYGRRYGRSCGSLLLEDVDVDLLTHPLNKADMTVYYGKLRRFAPAELLRLLGFPRWYRLPEHLTLAARYKLVGNSVSVTTVSCLMHKLFEQYQPS